MSEDMKIALVREPVRILSRKKTSRARARSLARSHTRTAIRVLVGIMRSEDATPAARVSAADAILDRGWGKLLVWSKVLGLGTTDALTGFAGQSRDVLLLRQARVRECCEDHQVVKIQNEEIHAIVAETLAEQHRIQQETIHAIVLKAVASAGVFWNRG